ncbi:polysaccharide deacetylase family protein [Nocardia sp. NBC_00508]|uniref:polysaccharide deacetylase family protein n=1 Tax=Nocardia sp. NBC_00508 TaxID=2975992 RepID=UPI002E812884|nr:polysaccharide deacetylase family protein [Nocardia sp. NBC_00508]WUD68216.1 polysaccharide deacetylase family protein [Nocardia sp. NBC_00508]
MRPTERIDYDPIDGRAPLHLPGGAKVAVWLIVNVEEWSDSEPMPRTVLTPPAGGVPSPDVPNWAWHEYGNRVGFWRMLRVLDAYEIPVALAVNGSAVAAYPQITSAATARNWEFIGHGYTQKNMQKVDDERLDIQRTRDAIAAATGRPPRGWLGPGLTETWETPDILVEEGYEYVCDWVLDDQPTLLRTRTAPIVNVPYTQECNDVAMMLIQHHSADEYRQRAIDQFDQLLADARADGSARVMALVVHPYIMGVPHRLRYLDRALRHISAHPEAHFCTGEQILDAYINHLGAVPGPVT